MIGIIAGGQEAIQKPIEHAEDSWEQGWLDLEKHQISDKDVVVGIAASGTTPYVIGALKAAHLRGIITGCITNNAGTPLAAAADYPIEVVVGPEICNRKHPHEKRHRTEAGAEYDLHFRDDPDRQGRRQ